jgi:outer membrane protein TolC
LFSKVSVGLNGQDNIDISETPVPGELVGKPGETVNMKFGKHYAFNAGIDVSYNLLDWQSVYQSKIAATNLELKKAGQSYFVQNLKEQLAQLYFASLTAEKAVRIGTDDLATADTLLNLTEDRFREGTVDALALNQARIRRNTVFEQLESTRQYRDECLSNLKISLGLDVGTELNLIENLSAQMVTGESEPLLPNDRLTDQYRLQHELSEYETKKAKAAFAPKIGFRAYFGNNQYQDNFSLSLKSSDWSPNNYVGMSVAIPVFTGFANRSQAKSAHIGQQIAENTYRDELRKTSINDSLLQQNYTRSIKVSASSFETFQLSKNNILLAGQKYKEGLLNLDGYLNIFDDYLSAESQYLNRLSEFLTNKATIESRK